MDPPPQQEAPPLTKRDIESLRIEFRECVSIVKDCRSHTRDADNRMRGFIEDFKSFVNCVCWLVVIYIFGSWLIGHIHFSW